MKQTHIDHYENFPVAAFFLPKNIRHALMHLYRYARMADDIADEGDTDKNQRMALLDDIHNIIQALRSSQNINAIMQKPQNAIFPPHSFWQNLQHIMHTHALSWDYLLQLRQAFYDDVVRDIDYYQTFDQILLYCQNSANPVGRLLLELYGAHTPQNCAYADAVCTALQLINFYQDVVDDMQKKRIYLPIIELQAAGISIDALKHICHDATLLSSPSPLQKKWHYFMQIKIQDAKNKLQHGFNLVTTLHQKNRRAAFELHITLQSALKVCQILEKNAYNVHQSAHLKWYHSVPILIKTVWMHLPIVSKK